MVIVKTKNILTSVLILFLSISSTFWYSLTPEYTKVLDNAYKKIDSVYEESPESIQPLLKKLEKIEWKYENNEKISYLLLSIKKYINSTANKKNWIINRKDTEDKYKWDLTKIYKNKQEIDEVYKKLEGLIKKLASYKWKLNDDVKLLEFLKLDDEFNIYAEDLWLYIYLWKSINFKDEKINLIKVKDDNVYSQYQQAISFFSVELKEFSDEKIDSLLNNIDFKNYKNYFKYLKNNKKHILSEKEEQLLISFSDSHISFNDIYKTLINLDIEYPEVVTPEWDTILANYANIYSVWDNNDRDFRKDYTKKLYTTYKEYENSLWALFISDKKEKTAYKKIRNYNSVLHAKYEWYELPEKAYDNLINTTKENLEVLHRYIKLKKDYLWIDEIHYYDLMAPLEENNNFYTYEESKAIVSSSLTKLWEKYLEDLNLLMNNNLIDVYQWENKDWWAFSAYAYNWLPHILLNFNNTFSDLKTLAHELWHSVNFYNITQNQPKSYYISSFPVEVPSLTNELLLQRSLADNAKTDKEKLFFLNEYMESLYMNYWRGVIYGDFERQIYTKIWNQEPVTTKILNETFKDLFKQYLWEDFTSDDYIWIEWAIKPHFFSSYYTHEYAVSAAIANQTATNIYNEKSWFTDKYLDYLKFWQSKAPNEALKTLDIDLTNIDYLKDSIKSQNEILDEMEEIIKRLKK